MEVKHSLAVTDEPVPEAPGVTIRWLWAGPDGAPNFALRLITVQPGAATPYHTHPFEHEVFILQGKALLKGVEREYELEPGDTALVLPDEEHNFQNAGPEPLQFLCAIPLPEDA